VEIYKRPICYFQITSPGEHQLVFAHIQYQVSVSIGNVSTRSRLRGIREGIGIGIYFWQIWGIARLRHWHRRGLLNLTANLGVVDTRGKLMGSRRSTLRASLILALRTTEEVRGLASGPTIKSVLPIWVNWSSPPCLDRAVSYLLDEYQRRVSPKRLGQANGMNPTLYRLSDNSSRGWRAGFRNLRISFLLYTGFQ
jgi:hypothetical protein